MVGHPFHPVLSEDDILPGQLIHHEPAFVYVAHDFEGEAGLPERQVFAPAGCRSDHVTSAVGLDGGAGAMKPG